MITDRERFLMREAAKVAKFNPDIDEWLSEIIDDLGHTVEQHLSFDADKYERDLEAEKVGV